MAKSADQTVVEALIQDFGEVNYPDTPADDIFELYAVNQVVKPHELGLDEASIGIVDGALDGGVDAFFIFVNGALLDVDSPLLDADSDAIEQLPNRPRLDVHVVQSKNRQAWNESVWEKLLSTLPELCDISTEDKTLEGFYNEALIERTGIFRRAVVALRGKFPQVTFTVSYCTLAPESNVSTTMQGKAEKVSKALKDILVTGATVHCNHVGVSTLYGLSAVDSSKPAALTFRKVIELNDSFVGVAAVADYVKFVRDGDGNLRQDMFDANVRDFEGQNVVNQSILSTLASDDQSEFWWMNNGVTVLADEVQKSGETVTLSRPLIVNGLQTSHVIDRAERDSLITDVRRNDGVVVRIIRTTDEDIRDQVIAGTNRQTRVASPSLYATQPLQQKIERFLLANEWYYERRKNRYKNLGKPAARRVSMNYLAQGLISMQLGQPDTARARPTTGLVRNYKELFDENTNQRVYLVVIELMKQLEAFLKTPEAQEVIDDFSNVRFYLAAGYVFRRSSASSFEDVQLIHNWSQFAGKIDEATALEVLKRLAVFADAFAESNPGQTRDSMFKNSLFREGYLSLFEEE